MMSACLFVNMATLGFDRGVSTVPSLFKACTEAVITTLPYHEGSLHNAPISVKEACLHLMSKRGLITDDNIDKVLFDRLQVLDLSMCHVSDACLFKLSISRYNYLRKVDLNSAKDSNESITSAGLTSLSRACPNLQILYLRRCINITDSGIISISENCPFLVELNIGGCPRITDATLISLGQNCRHLRSFNFSKSEVTDCGVLSLVSGTCATCLKEIHMNGCANLTDESVEAVIQFCPQISILLFHGCPHITEHARNALEELMLAESSKVRQITWTVY